MPIRIPVTLNTSFKMMDAFALRQPSCSFMGVTATLMFMFPALIVLVVLLFSFISAYFCAVLFYRNFALIFLFFSSFRLKVFIICFSGFLNISVFLRNIFWLRRSCPFTLIQLQRFFFFCFCYFPFVESYWISGYNIRHISLFQPDQLRKVQYYKARAS